MKNMKIPRNTVIQYIRKNRKPCGVIVALKTDNGYVTGHSLFHKKDAANKHFVKKEALQIAIGRAQVLIDNANAEGKKRYTKTRPAEIPASVGKVFDSFIERCNTYYKCSGPDLSLVPQTAVRTLSRYCSNS